MTPQEQQLLQDLCARLTLTQGQPKDVQADAELRRGLSAAPDALYWLAQRTLMLEQAMQQAQQQITQLQQQVQQQAQQLQQSQEQRSASQGAGSFLSGGIDTHFGRAPDAYSQSAAQPSYATQAAAQSAQPSGWRDRFFGSGAGTRVAQPQAYAPQAAPAAQGSSFLGNAAAAAAGVAGGMFLFNGLGNLMGNHHAGANSGANSLFGGDDSQAAQSASENLHGGVGDTSSLANDAGLNSIDSAASSDWDDGGGFFDDDFA